jgi:hypothetical protein
VNFEEKFVSALEEIDKPKGKNIKREKLHKHEKKGKNIKQEKLHKHENKDHDIE